MNLLLSPDEPVMRLKKLERQMIYLSSRTLMHCIPSRMHKDVY